MKDINEYRCLGDFIVDHRESKALTQTQFAKVLGINRSRLSLIECGHVVAGPKAIRAIAKATKTPIEKVVELSKKTY